MILIITPTIVVICSILIIRALREKADRDTFMQIPSWIKWEKDSIEGFKEAAELNYLKEMRKAYITDDPAYKHFLENGVNPTNEQSKARMMSGKEVRNLLP